MGMRTGILGKNGGFPHGVAGVGETGTWQRRVRGAADRGGDLDELDPARHQVHVMYERARNLEGEARRLFLSGCISYKNLRRGNHSVPCLTACAPYAKGPSSRTRAVPRWMVLVAKIADIVTTAAYPGGELFDWRKRSFARAAAYIEWCLGQESPVDAYLAMETIYSATSAKAQGGRDGARERLDTLAGVAFPNETAPKLDIHGSVGGVVGVGGGVTNVTLRVLSGGASPVRAVDSIAEVLEKSGDAPALRSISVRRWVESELAAIFASV